MSFDFDLFVIGGGSGGVRAARLAAQTGAKVGLAEEYRMGGTCVIRGCVPKKLMVYAAGFQDAFEDSRGFGWTVGETGFSWKALIEAKDREIERLEGLYRKGLESSGVTIFDSRAALANPHTVTLADGASLTAQMILVATGGAPFVPGIPGAELAITSNEIFHLGDLPRRALVVGGGYIACEFAGILSGLGSSVTQFYRGEQILRGFDREVRDHVAGAMKARGIDLRVNADVERLVKTAGGVTAVSKQGEELEFDTVLYAAGRRPNASNLGLEKAGVKTGSKGEIVVDRFSQTSVPSVFAVGDVTDRVNLTPVAIREGAAFVETALKGNPTPADHELIPTAVFTRPEIGTVGLTEEEASGRDGAKVYRACFRPMANILAGRDEKTLMKLIVGGPEERVLGVHIVGPGAGEMIQLAGVAVKMGATKRDFDRTVAVHPTAAEELVTLK